MTVIQNTRGNRPPRRMPSIGPAIAELRNRKDSGESQKDVARASLARSVLRQLRGRPRAVLRRIAADSYDPRRAAASRRLEIRAERDAMCARQLDWQDFDVLDGASRDDDGTDVSQADTH